jgi:gliding motility-associated-like protein
VDLGGDRIICEGNSVALDAGDGFEQYLWQDGSSAQYYSISQPGLYWAEVYNVLGCHNRDSIFIDISPLPDVDLGPDIVLEPDQTVQLDAGEGFQSYLWQDGSTAQYLDVNDQGAFWVTVWNEFCQASDTILVQKQDCEASLFIPNCFTPNGDGYNEEFLVVAENLESFEMIIFNRWGQRLFETSDINDGWNGKVNGVLSPQGTYFYLVRFTTLCIYGLEGSGVRKGSVTLLE